MPTGENGMPMLNGFRVLDLTDEKGILCGRILGDLGADVIKVERPGGDLARQIGPFYKDTADPNKSLFWFFHNLNKRGITLDITSTDGREIFKKLVRKADFVIESFSTGYLKKLGLDYSHLSRINRRIIVTSITPFGQTGPYKNFKTSDIVSMAMSGLLYITGDPDRYPVRISFPQAYSHAASEAAAATMVAHYYRQQTGKGQHIDTSIHHSVLHFAAHVIPIWQLTKVNQRRAGNRRSLRKCKDGIVMYGLLGSPLGGKNNRALAEWMESEGVDSDLLKTTDWDALDMHMTTLPRDTINRVEETINKFCETYTKAELYGEAIKRGIMLHPVSTVRDVVDDSQLKARGFWTQVDHPELGTAITYPGCFIKASESPCSIRRRAPLIGEHNLEIYQQELGFSKEQLVALKQDKVI